TTEQILEWAAKKWGFDPDLAKAMAAEESSWNQAMQGDNATNPSCAWNCPGGSYPTGYQSYGILQVKRTSWPGSYPLSEQSTAFNADYAMAAVRYHYDGGSSSWLGNGARGEIHNAVGGYYCGCGYTGSGEYATAVFEYYESKPWVEPDGLTSMAEQPVPETAWPLGRRRFLALLGLAGLALCLILGVLIRVRSRAR